VAKRPVFVPVGNPPYVEEKLIEFKWYHGRSKAQVGKCILSFHQEACKLGLSPTLEISTRSPNKLGVALSAFNLKLRLNTVEMTVECAFQGSKVFENGGPYIDLYYVSSRKAKTDERLRSSGRLIAFRFFQDEFPLDPPQAFYDFLYLTALQQHPNLASILLRYNSFSDIAFNPKRSINCQARSAALYVSLHRKNIDIRELLENKSYYLHFVSGKPFSEQGKSLFAKQMSLPNFS
jgi:hypothetical protein